MQAMTTALMRADTTHLVPEFSILKVEIHSLSTWGDLRLL